MNKKLITLAVAAALAAPAAAMAEATLYGKVHVSIDYVDVDRYANWGGVPVLGGNPDIPLGAFGPRPSYLSALQNGTVDPFKLDDNGNTIVDTDPVTVEETASVADIADGEEIDIAGYDVEIQDLTGAPGVTQTITADGDIETSVNVYDYVFARRQATLINDGVEPGVATVVATRDALEAATQEASQDQLAAAYRDAMLGARGEKFNGWTLNGNGRASRVGVKGSEDLGNGIKAIYQIEFQVPITNEDTDIDDGDGDSIKMRNSFVGLAGNFGTFLVGRHDTPLKISTGKLDLFADTLADYNYTIGFHDVRADNAIAYISPSFSGFSFAAALIPAGGATPWGAYNADNDSIASAWSVAAIYNNGPFYVSAAYENLGDEHWTDSDPLEGTIYNGVTRDNLIRGLYGRGVRDDTKWRIGLGILDWNGFTMTGIYESRTNVLGVPRTADLSLWQIQAGYAFGNNMIKGMYGQADVERCADPFGEGYAITCGRGFGLLNNKDTSSWAIGFDHNFSKRTKVYALYTALESDQDDADWSGFSLGMIHKF